MDKVLEVRGLTKDYQKVRALDGLDLSLAPDQVVGLLGENGCGKTTLLKILGGVLSDYTGEVRVAGHHPGPESKGKVAYLPDAAFLPESVNAGYCVDYFSDFFADFNPAKATDLVGHFGLRPTQKVKEMSKGMREKLQIALVLSRAAPVVLLDEPISGIDPAAREVILSGVMRGLSEDSLLVIATHLIHDLEPVLDAVVMMRRGKVLVSGQVDDLRAEHRQSIDQLFRKVYS